MNFIALTGCNARAMADVAEHLLARVTDQGLAVAIFLYVDKPTMVEALRNNNPDGVGELWRVGPDPGRPGISHLVDAWISDTNPTVTAEETEGQLKRFAFRVQLLSPTTPAPTGAAPAHPPQKETT